MIKDLFIILFGILVFLTLVIAGVIALLGTAEIGFWIFTGDFFHFVQINPNMNIFS